MFGRHGTLWQVTIAVVGLAIVALVLIGPRARERATMITSPAAIVGVGSSTADRVQTAPAIEQTSDPAAPAPADPAAPAPDPSRPGAPAQPGTGVSGGVSGGVQATTGGALPSAPAVSSLSNVAGTATKTLFSDNFQNDPLASALPTGWSLLDTVTGSTGGGLLGGLPLVGGLLGGGATQTVTSLLPTTLLDGGTHVLGRATGSWQHLTVNAAGSSSWADYTATADLKPISGSGFVGVGGRVQNASNYLTCGIVNGQGLELLQVVNGQSQVLSSKPLSIAPNVFHTVQMTMQGGSVSCAMDGVTVLNGKTSTLTSGPLGLIALGSLASEFDNVRALALP
ncbi:MAG TPA: hypothetical protein VOB72_10245 [Candidatus Dormibacteraeota bacterium]|nr:hypothetical protein [Candidatus Dormibacteraeota bacterium]